MQAWWEGTGSYDCDRDSMPKKTNERALAKIASFKHIYGTKKVDFDALQSIGRNLLLAIGENPLDPRIKDTPLRFAKWWREFIEYDPGSITTIFNEKKTDQMIVISGMRVFSLCEHHLLPFFCHVSIGYIPKGKILGLSKFARIAHLAAHKIQTQENMVQEIADTVERVTASKDVAVLGCGEHFCMLMRGIRTQGLMTSSAMRGAFRKEPSARAEFMELAKGVKP